MLFLFHSVCPSTFNVVAMGTADVQAVCNVLKEEEEQEKTLLDKLNELLNENKVSQQLYIVLVSIIIDMHKENVDK